MTYTTVFDASQQGYENFWSLAPQALGFATIGAMLVFAPALMQRILPYGLQGEARKVFSWIFFAFSLLFGVGTSLGVISEQLRVTADLREGRYAVVEGPVANFVPMPYEGHAVESFTVNGHPFSYSNYIMTQGFRNAASHGGPIREGLNVRISYSENLILRLEVAQ